MQVAVRIPSAHDCAGEPVLNKKPIHPTTQRVLGSEASRPHELGVRVGAL